MNVKLLFLILFPLHTLAQDITGVWVGSLQNEANHLTYEIAISKQKDHYSGYAMTVFQFDGKENIGIKTISLKIKSGRILIEDGELVYHNYSTPPKHIKLFANMLLSDQGANLRMRGEFHTRTLDYRASDKTSYKGVIRLEKTASTSTVLLARLAQLNLLAGLSFMKKDDSASAVVVTDPASIQKSVPIADIDKRKKEIIQNIAFTSDSLRLSLYDNGEVDGDSVSIVLNGKLILARQALTSNAFTATIYATPDLGDSLQLVLYAENLGSIPPNTGLLIVEDGKNKHEIRFSGDLQKSAAIILRRKRT